ncbi:MAG TPA: hypothetical protein PK640_11945, partial [Verrucomicrobiota bacterium]|nr:hypothetical protein [Verrucomicrobiota bacterium]
AKPQPFVKSAGPTGPAVRFNTAIAVELQDYVTHVVPSSVRLEVNGQAVMATVSKPVASAITTVTYAPAGGWVQGSTNAFRIVFADDAVPPVVQTSDFGFAVLDEALAAAIVNIDFTGTQNEYGPRGPGPLYVGQGPAGGGTAWSEIALDTRLPDGTDDRTLSASGNDLVNSLGETTTVGFTMGPVGADDWYAGTDPAAADALWGDYLFFMDSVSWTQQADFTISGLGDVPWVDLYFLSGSHAASARSFIVTEGSRAPYTANGIFTPANTLYFAKVPVTDGTVTGSTGNPALTVLNGLTIRQPLPQPFIKSASPTGNTVRRNTAIKVELQDYVTRVVPSSVQLEVNGQAVVATVSKPAGSTVTTITYTPAGGWASASTNTFRIIFGDDAVPPVTQTGDFAFVALNESLAAATINIDFTGIQNDPGPRGPGPLYVGQGPAGGGTAWSEIVLDTRLWDGTDDRTLSASGTNLVNSLGDATTVGFIMGPVGADDWFGGADPAAADALWGDYLFFVDSVMGVERADFTISGLGIVPSVDLYFLSGSHGPGARSFVVNGASPAAFVANGIFTPDNTLYFANVPVTDGTVTGSTGNPALCVLNGLTIRKLVSQPQTLTIVRQGNSVVVSWTGTGTLQIADRVTGGWNDLPNATSPQTVTPAEGQKFYRLRQ